MTIRMLALDIDDTLIPSSLELSEQNRRAIELAHNKGVEIVICTGRSFIGTRQIREKLNLSDCIICFGGANIHNTFTGELLHSTYLKPEHTRAVMRAARSLGIHSQIYQGETVVSAKENEFTKRYTEALNLPFKVDTRVYDDLYEGVPKVLCFSLPQFEKENAQKLRKMIPSELHIFGSKPGFFEIGSNESTKGEALKWLAAKKNIPIEQVAAIGDNTLDLDMIVKAGIGCCVENGNPLVKAQADLIIPSCQDNGVAWFIDEYILKEGSEH